MINIISVHVFSPIWCFSLRKKKTSWSIFWWVSFHITKETVFNWRVILMIWFYKNQRNQGIIKSKRLLKSIYRIESACVQKKSHDRFWLFSLDSFSWLCPLAVYPLNQDVEFRHSNSPAAISSKSRCLFPPNHIIRILINF